MQDRRELIKAIVEAVGPPIDAKNETVLTTIRAEIKASEKKVVEKIDASQKDTIEALSTVIHEGHSDHENRIRQLEQDHKFPHSH